MVTSCDNSNTASSEGDRIATQSEIETLKTEKEVRMVEEVLDVNSKACMLAT